MSEKASSLIRDRVGCVDGWYRTEGGEMRSQLMDAADAVEAIESENAMLRTQLADVTESMGRVEERCAELREQGARLFDKTLELGTENAKLRELARDVNKAAHMLCEAWEGSCSKEADGMSLYAVCPISDTNELCVFGKLHDRMRELGVVVE